MDAHYPSNLRDSSGALLFGVICCPLTGTLFATKLAADCLYELAKRAQNINRKHSFSVTDFFQVLRDPP